MSVWDRGRRPHFGDLYYGEGDDLPSGPLSELKANDPNSMYFKFPPKLTLKTVVGCLLSVQKERYGQTILDVVPKLSWAALARHAKTFIDLYDIQTVYRAVLIAADRCKHPFSFKVVGEICAEYTRKHQPDPIYPRIIYPDED